MSRTLDRAFHAGRSGARRPPVVVAVVLAGALAGCTVLGPDYRQPATASPGAYREVKAVGSQSAPAKPLPERWWQLFGDGELNALEDQAEAGNPQIDAAIARVEQARAVARFTSANTGPLVQFDPSASRSRQSDNRAGQPYSPVIGYTANDFRIPAAASYEIDFWGKNQRLRESAYASAEAELDAYQTVRLGLHGDIATSYFAIREIDNEIEIVRNSIELFKQSLALVRARFKGGITSELDLARAQEQLAATESEALGLQQRRAQFEYALAVLIGKTPAEFSLAPVSRPLEPPMIPAGVPSDVLQRRPDIAQTERVLAARSADIGVARAGYFPSVNLTGLAGFESLQLSSLLKSGSLISLIGANVTMPLFDNGRNQANVDRAKAAYSEALALYKLRVLAAFQDVESALAGLRVLAQQSEAQSRAVSSAQQSTKIATTRYKAGLVTFLDVIDAERSALADERLLAQLSGNRMSFSVALVKALGGGWRAPERAAMR